MKFVSLFFVVLGLCGCTNSMFGGVDQQSSRAAFRNPSRVDNADVKCELPKGPANQSGSVLVHLPRVERSGTLVSLKCGGALLVGNSVQRFDVTTQNWQMLSPLKFPRNHPKLLVLQSGKILVEGGYAFDGKKVTPVLQIEVYDPETQESEVGPMSSGQFGYGTMAEISDSRIFIIGQRSNSSGWQCNSAAVLDLKSMTWTDIGAPSVYCPEVKAYTLASGDIMVMSDVNGFHPSIFRVGNMKWDFAVPSPEGDEGISGITTAGNVFLSVSVGKLLQWNDKTIAWDTIATVERPRDGSGYYGVAKAIGLPGGKYAFYSRRNLSSNFDGDIYDPVSLKWTQLPVLQHGGFYGLLFMALVSNNQFVVINEDSEYRTSSELISF